MASTPSQRVYSAPCPGCGAPVNFSSAQASFAVCQYCRSTVVRDGEVLKRLGTMAEVFEDYSPLQIGVTGVAPRKGRNEPFTLIGRLQMRSQAGTWSEWVALLADGTLGYLSEDNGQFVWSLPWDPGWTLREFNAREWRLGREVKAQDQVFSVASVQDAELVAAQGQLSELPPQGKPYKLVELRDSNDRVLTVDFGAKQPAYTLGVAVDLDKLRLTGLRADASQKKEQGRHFNCPKCGAAISVRFDGTKSLSCPSCASLIDLSAGIGQELSYAEQKRKPKLQIPLGSEATLEGRPWQVVGYQMRSGRELGEEDEGFHWDEYLLYNAKAGFAFLVDSEDGWSMGRVAVGAPKVSQSGQVATYLRNQYARESAYLATTLYAEGEFYWPVYKGQVTSNVDFVNPAKKSSLAQETEKNETTWTHATQIAAATLATAFGLKELRDRSAVSPVSTSGMGCGTIFFGLFVLWIVIIMVRGCSSSSCDPRVDVNCSSSRSSGGSFGGFSSGGSHK